MQITTASIEPVEPPALERLPRHLPVMAVIAIALILILSGYLLWQSRTNLEREANNNAQNLSNVLERYIYSAIHESDLALQVSADEYQRLSKTKTGAGEDYSDFLETLRTRLPQILSLRATDANGLIKFGAGIDPEKPVNIADRDRFKLTKNTPGLSIAAPIVGRMSQQWVLPISRRLALEDGSFEGIVYANIAIRYLNDLFASLDMGRRGVVVLFDAETHMYTRHPEPAGAGSALGLTVSSTQFKAQWQLNKKEGAYRAQSTTDGIWRTYSYRQVGDYPLFIIVGLAEKDYLAPWRTHVVVTALVLLVLASLVTMLSGSLWRAVRAQRRAYAVLTQGQRLLQESEQRYRTVADFTADWEYWITPEGAFSYLSPACEQVSGYSVEEFQANPHLLTQIVHPEDLPLFAGHTHHLSAQGRPLPIVFRILTKSGECRWVSHACRPVFDAAGQTLGQRASNRDITELKQAEAELLRSNRELEQFSYSISHDMRQPLRMISSYLQLLETQLADQLDGEKREYFNFALDGAKRLDAMMLGLLEYSRVGRKGEPPAWVQSRALLDEALHFLQPAIAEAQAEVCVLGSWPQVQTRPDEMLRLLQNLVSNALKFRVAGRPPEITVVSDVQADHWRVSVSDNGIGIAPEQVGRLFQVFQRLHSRTAFEGTGIGLALCRKIAEQQGGRIWVESEGDGRGSRFCVELPRPAE